jgi:predicted CXXCH cytochrome family protein
MESDSSGGVSVGRLFALLVGVALATNAGSIPVSADVKPVGGKALCLACHADLQADLEGRVMHAPVEADRCTDCHDPHASRHSHMLRAKTGTLCASCHEDTRAETLDAYAHGALRDERSCLACHAPHSAAETSLLRDSPEVLCVSCHEPVTAQIDSDHPHAPVALGECASCHEPHGGPRAALLATDLPGLCWECHDNDDALRGSHRGFSLERADCRSCHDPHGGEGPALVRTAAHPPFAEQMCDTCHASDSDPARFVDEQPGLCVVCHDDRDPEGHAEGSHPIGNEVVCTDCHSPHAGEGPGLRGAERGICLGCHDEIRVAIATLKSHHPITAEGGRCTACHQAHDSDTPPLLARKRDALCSDCHRDHSRFTHPMGPNVPDPSRPGRSVDCLSCHDPHASEYKMMLRASSERDLCVGCHAQPN